MSRIKLVGTVIILLLFLFGTVSFALADDLELSIDDGSSNNAETSIDPIYGYMQYGTEVIPNTGLVGTVGGGGSGARIVVTPIQHEITVTAGKLATETFRITNLGHSDATVEVTIEQSTDRKIFDKTTFDGQTSLSRVIIPASGYANNYRDVNVVVNTDFATGITENDFYTLDVLVTDGSRRELHHFKINVQPPVRVTPFSLLGLSVLDLSATSTQCINDTFTGKENCVGGGFFPNGLSLTLGMLLIIIIGLFVGMWLFVAWKRKRRDIVPIEDDEGEPVEYYSASEDEHVVDDEEEDEKGYRF